MPLLQNPPVPVAQATQAAPPVPHWAAEVEVIQLMPVQQPVGQEVALQALLHPSELGGQYVPVFMQPQPQAVYEGIALQVKPAQTPLVHTAEPMPEVGPGQTTPHAPQLYGSVLVLVQVLPQTVALQVEVQAPLVQGTPLEHAVPQLPQLEGSDEGVVQKMPHNALGLAQVSLSPAACILYSTSRLASAPVVDAQVEPVRSEADSVAPAAKVNTMGPLSDQYCPGVSTRSCPPVVPSVKRNTAAGQPAVVGVLAVAAMRNTVIAWSRMN
jgi:hypothetical protein